MTEHYDYLIVGAGLFGSVFAREITDMGKRCLVIEKRDHIGGNAYTKEIEDITVHCYGAHIFHTNDKVVWDYLNRFATFNRYTNSPVANYRGKLYSLPFNMNTFYQMWGVTTPTEAQKIIQSQCMALNIPSQTNLENKAIQLVGKDIYEKLIKGYTEKQWGRPCSELPEFIIQRLPVRFTFDNNYFDALYQGIPVGGYTKLFEQLLHGIEVRLNVDFLQLAHSAYRSIADKIIYTGPIDAYFNYRLGALEYRSLRFEEEVLDMANYQGVAVMNYTDRETPYTRIIEHKHFEFGTQQKTVITREYSTPWQVGAEPYYPINDERNSTLYEQYRVLALEEPNVVFAGRLGEYRYYDMDTTVAAALALARSTR